MFERLLVVVALTAFYSIPATPAVVSVPNDKEASTGPEYWRDIAKSSLRDALKMKRIDGVAKNIIFFLGDGMSLATVTAARILKGQKDGKSGEEGYLSFEKFNDVALIKTYNVDRQVSDSAGTATAYLCGVKANYETVGVDERAKLGQCDTLEGTQVTSILEWAQNEGKHTGFVTTARVTHASPAGLYAHSVNRYWESDADKVPGAEKCKDIALQLVEDSPGSKIKLIMGGGRSFFFPNDTIDPLTGSKCSRRDKRDLVGEWIELKKKDSKSYNYMTTLQEFEDWDPNETDFVLGLFGMSHMQYEVDRENGPKGQPSIAQMTKKAIEMLSKEPKGYFIFIEGGRIDHAHHDNYAVRALNEALAMDDAVKVAMDMTDEEDTLIIVTADHSHVMTINGYPGRGNSIFGIAQLSDVDNLPYTTLMYTNGMGFNRTAEGVRPNITGVDTAHKNYRPLTALPIKDETHGGDDVPLYARGPMAHLFHGVLEQHYIPHALAYASCVGSDKGNCKRRELAETDDSDDSDDSDDKPKKFQRSGTVSFRNREYFLVVFVLVFAVSASSLLMY